MPAPGDMIRWGDERARTGPWRADGSVAFLAPVPDGRPPSAEFLHRCLGQLAEKGYAQVVTGALGPSEQAAFREVGFVVLEHLDLLVLPAGASLPPVPRGPRLHRAGPVRRRRLLEVDAAAFDPFWRLDGPGLREALRATSRRHLRVALGRGRRVTGYAICGVAAGWGYVQRLAVSPPAQGNGFGKRLLVDGLHWLRSCGAEKIA